MIDQVHRDCPAKINLFLRVLAQERDGYHNIETLFCQIALADSLVVMRAGAGVALRVEGADLGQPEENLAWRAADAVLQATGRSFGVALTLTKRIPAGAGLGGGSSDAAAALLAVNQLANHAVPRAELLQMAYRLGADVPFFLLETSCAIGWGHGQRLFELPALPSAPALLVIPPVPVSTSDAYGWIDAARQSNAPRGSVALDREVLSRWSDIARLAGNDFESVVFGRVPAVRSAFEAVAHTRPLLCRMSGSGSAIVGVYRNARDRDDAALEVGARHGHVIPTETR